MNDLAELFKLSVEERLQLVEDLWDSIAADTDNLPPLSQDQIVEIERRLAEHEKDPSTALEWENVREELWARYR
ncbi:MAG TPA: addiction module protein [Rhizomicrobium sp.]|jgi:putative addiction module component (TIGR02574 family)